MTESTNTTAPHRIRTISYWTSTAIIVFVMASGAVAELTHQWGTLETHTVLGYPIYFLSIIGTWKALGAAALVAPRFQRLKEWAYAGMFFNMTGAFISHAIVGDGMYHLVATGAIALLVVTSWALRPSSRTLGVLWPVRTSSAIPRDRDLVTPAT
jgi:DoxX-like protein